MSEAGWSVLDPIVADSQDDEQPVDIRNEVY
jgi:hypothetical protein